MFGLSRIFFGRSREVQRLDEALRAAGLNPSLVPKAVKFTVVKLPKEEPGGVDASATTQAAELFAYCMLGAGAFAVANGRRVERSAEGRLEAALEACDSLDARIVLLALHAGLIEPGLVARYGLEAS